MYFCFTNICWKTQNLPMFHSKLQTKNNSRCLQYIVGVGRKDTVRLVALGILIMPMLCVIGELFFLCALRNKIHYRIPFFNFTFRSVQTNLINQEHCWIFGSTSTKLSSVMCLWFCFFIQENNIQSSLEYGSWECFRIVKRQALSSSA